MIQWNNLDTLKAYQALKNENQPVDLRKELSGASAADRVAKYCIPMSAGLVYSYAAKQVDDKVLEKLRALAEV